MSAPEKVIDLIERFNDNRHAYMSTGYNETQVRRELIDPLFKALGWDIDNEAGYAEGYKDVVHEDAIKVGGATKAPDYAFRIGGTRKFFVEAKRPGVNIKEDIDAAYQLRRYAWSAKLPLSIVTDFEEFAVYDCRIKPNKNDKASVARVMYITYDEYPDKWEEISSIFSPEAIRKGSFDKYAQSKKKKRGTAEVDDAFLKEIENWRDILARNIALRNTELSTRELNYAVQRTIDRIIFLRICEDRGIEKYAQLMSLQNGVNAYQRLCQIFRRADERYNSGLFHFQKGKDRTDAPDELTLDLKIDDKVLKGILKDLYYPESPYEFSVLPADILGHIYEQFLGKVIRLTPAHYAKVEDKPEVKKAGGVYYTPTYIVDYIVEHTVGELLKRKIPTKVSKLRILDPACGSGSFLLGAYQTLLDWHLQWYQKHDAEKHAKGSKPKIYHGPGGDWRLTTSEKKRILLNNIYGVDIDPQAVEVTKLSLLLKVLEGENEETLVKHLRLFHERALPDLGDNIKCGNSLIGPDFYEGKQLSLIDEEERYRINAFDWNSEFPHIFPSPPGRGQGEGNGFDTVIGNPPWISLTGKFGAKLYSKSDISYMIQKFAGNTYMPNMYEYFVAQAISLLAVDGYFGYIVPDRLGFNSQFLNLRRRILNHTQIISLIYKAPFPGITADTLIFVLQRSDSINPKLPVEIGEYGHEFLQIPQREFVQDPVCLFQYYDSVGAMRLVRKLECSPHVAPLGNICETTSGFGGRSELITPNRESYNQIEALKGDSINRYSFKKLYWFDFKKANITGRTTDKAKLGAKPKILLRKTGNRILATYDDSGVFPEQSLYFLFNSRDTSDFKYLLGILNSALISFYYRNRLITNRRSIAQLKKVHLDAIPIRTINFANSTCRTRHDQIVGLVDAMLKLHKDLQSAKTDHEKSLIQRQIDATDKQIDQFVYELYGLTEEEGRLVEEQR